MTTQNRPLSPHVRIYRFPLNAMLSGSHRITGVLLTVGTLLFTYWVAAAAYGPESYERAQAFLGSWFGQLILFGWTGCLFFHMCNGVRHLLWDMGYLLEKEELVWSSYATLAATAALTLGSWVAAYLVYG